jgi:hypothetical protein
MALVAFEPLVPANERPQTHALDRMATELGIFFVYCMKSLRYRNYFAFLDKSTSAVRKIRLGK